jgi:ribosomal protein S18 acetylase RimI-like enzyme
LLEFSTVEENLRYSFRVLAADRPRGEVREIAGVSIAAAGTPFQMFNAAFLAGPVSSQEDLERRIAAAQVHFRVRGLEWSLWVCSDLLPAKLKRRAESIFDRHGLRLAVRLPGMSAERLLPPRRALPAIEVRRVGDESTRLAFCDIGCTCFHVPLNWFREIFLRRPLWDGDFVGYVGYVDGEPVATAATVTAAGAIGVYNVATLPGYRRKGHGEAVMRYAVERAREQSGCQRTILQATEHGLPLYLSMGYRTVTNVDVYAAD